MLSRLKKAENYINNHAWLGNILLGLEGIALGVMFALAI